MRSYNMNKFRCCFLTGHYNKKMYYREWLSGCGWGVMLSYDTIMAYSSGDAQRHPAANHYAIDKSFEFCYPVKKEHLHLDIEQLQELYGHQELGKGILYGGDKTPHKFPYKKWLKRLIPFYKDYLL